MNNSSILSFVIGFTLLFTVPACGGGGGNGGGGLAGTLSTLATGNITSVDGDSGTVDDVLVEVPAVGRSARSALDGTFHLGRLPAAPIRIVFSAPSGTTGVVPVDLSRGGSAVIRVALDRHGGTRSSVESCDGQEGENETRAALTSLSSPVTGHVEIRARANGDMKLEVEAEHLSPGQQVEFVITDLGGTEASLGTVAADATGESEVEIETEHGGVLPFAATTVQELEGFAVTVRDVASGTDLLIGEVPALGLVPTTCGSDDSGSGGDETNREGRRRLSNAPGVTGEADVELESRSDRDEEEFELKVEFTNVTGGLEAFLEDPSSPGTLVSIGNLVLDDDGDLKLEFETDDGDTLPFGVATASELVGLAIEIRRVSDGTVAYSGVTPPMNES